jgi:prepilin peptidase CpaA
VIVNTTQIVPALAVAVGICAAITDVRARRIPNRLTYSAMVAGLILQGILYGWKGMLLGVEGGLLFGGLFMLFYMIRAMGAGDVKLAAALGSIVGISATLPVMLATVWAGAALAICFMVLSGRVVETLRNTLWVTGFHVQHGLQVHPVVNLDNPAGGRMPYGLAFAAGTAYWALSGWWG